MVFLRLLLILAICSIAGKGFPLDIYLPETSCNRRMEDNNGKEIMLFNVLREVRWRSQSFASFTIQGNCLELSLVQSVLGNTETDCCVVWNKSMCSLNCSSNIANNATSIETWRVRPQVTCANAFYSNTCDQESVFTDLVNILQWDHLCIIYTEDCSNRKEVLVSSEVLLHQTFSTSGSFYNDTDSMRSAIEACIWYTHEQHTNLLLFTTKLNLPIFLREMKELASEYQGLEYTSRVVVVTDPVSDSIILDSLPPGLINVAILQYSGVVGFPQKIIPHGVKSVVIDGNTTILRTSVVWNSYCQKEQHSDVLPSTRYGLNGVHLKVTTKEWDPFTIKKRENGTIRYEGMCIDLLKHLSGKLNFTFTLAEPLDDEWGVFKEGSWTGMIGQLAKKEVDIMIGAISVQKERAEVMDYTYPFYFETCAVLYKNSISVTDLWLKIFRPFHWTTLLLLGASLVIVGLVLSTIEYYKPLYAQNKSPFARWDTSIWYLLAALLREGGNTTAHSQSGRTIIASWWLFSILIITTYTGDLIANFSVDTNRLRIKSLKGLADQSGYKVGIEDGSYVWMLLSNSEDDVLQRIWKGVQEHTTENPSMVSTNISFHLEKVNEGNYAFINDRSLLSLVAEKDCEKLKVIKESLCRMSFAIGLHQNSMYGELFSRQILYFHETGIISAAIRKWWPKNITCSGHSQIGKAKPIGFEDLQGFYMITIAVIVLSVLTLVYEKIKYQLQKRRL